MTRISLGNFSNVKGVGSGVFEHKLGSGYRIYLARTMKPILMLLGGGTKKRQRRDISAALAKWQDYKRRK